MYIHTHTHTQERNYDLPVPTIAAVIFCLLLTAVLAPEAECMILDMKGTEVQGEELTNGRSCTRI